ncbi:amidase [Acididesulfobacillus acetoxydans]|uniref:Amidase n=1 Tax=Acididesulfobacillus acetoxydans TaxID=1561005 RepID=A0A8S0VXZ6_9FIRM|nr:glucosaminidase domain-containing protein [Acididesulfobacillus acetoxydans]CAA7602453.1 amidase [Acididesulfobacillus acetoxydans]CEJ05908.1 Mannosyl-glycoprotein endo-beta-N-acetylglucosaminidase [Acididesulfobacillus acetoxydans]
MPDSNIHLQTSADLSGVNAVKQGLIEIRNLAQEIAKQGIPSPSGGGTPGATPQTFTERAKQRIREIQERLVNSTTGAQAIIGKSGTRPTAPSQPSGVEVGEWMEQNMPIVNAMMGGGSSAGTSVSNGRVPKPQKFVPKPGTIPTPQSVLNQYRNKEKYTPEYYKDFFLSAGKNLPPGSEMYNTWHEYNRAWVGGDERAPQNFHESYAAESNMVPVPTPPPPPPIPPRPSNNGGGAMGNAMKAVLPSRGIGAALGAAVGGMGIGGLALGGIATAAIGLGVASVSSYMKSADALSGLTKQILATHDGLSKLQNTVLGAGAAFGYAASQSAAIANALGPAYGSLALGQMGTKVSQVAGFSRAYGISSSAASQGFAGAAQLGITTGPGSAMNMGQFGWSLANSASQSGMSGRMSELMQAVLSATQAIQSTSVTSNPSTLLGIMTAMNANLPRSMQGAGSASILGSLSSGIANPGMGGAGQLVNYEAFANSGVSNYWQYLHAKEMGPNYVLPNGKTSLEAVIGESVRTWGTPKLGNAKSGYAPGNQAAGVEEYALQQMYGLSMPQSGAMLSLFGPGGPGVAGLKNNLGITSGQMKNIDMGKLGLLGQLNSAHSAGQLQAVEKQWEAGGGRLGLTQQKALRSASLADQKKMLAQDILSSNYKPLTTSEKLESIVAEIQKTLNTAGGHIADIANKIVGNATKPSKQSAPSKSDLYNAEKRGGVIGGGATPPANSALHDAELRGGVIGPTSFVTPGGAQYSPGIVQTMMSFSGANNAFSWMRTPGGGMGGGLQQLMYRDSGGSGMSLSGSSKDFVSKMSPYAQQASQRTGLPASYILGQWGEESGWGTSAAARQNLNFAGIKPFGGLSAGPDSKYAGFGSLNEFVRAYSNTINSSRYTGARNAAMSGASARDVFDLLHREGYAADPNYGSTVAGAVNSVIKTHTTLDDQSIHKLAAAIKAGPSGLDSTWQVPRSGLVRA